MQIETPPTEKPYEKSEGERRGLIIVNTGDGKGKSTSAFGLALRAHGRAKKVKIFQFMKVPSARFGEHRMFEQLGIPIEGLGDGFSWKSQDLEHSAQLARDGWQKAKAAIQSGVSSSAVKPATCNASTEKTATLIPRNCAKHWRFMRARRAQRCIAKPT